MQFAHVLRRDIDVVNNAIELPRSDGQGAARPEVRSSAMGLASAGGSLGQVLLIPYAQSITTIWGTAAALIGLSILVLAISPLGYLIRGSTGGPYSGSSSGNEDLSAMAAVHQALGHRGYCLLTIGFFTCGFQLAFIATRRSTSENSPAGR